MMDKSVCELFAGVGGFRLGLERADKSWDTVWFNQYEPKTKRQDAYDCYVAHFGQSKSFYKYNNSDISTVDKSLLPDFNVLVGGFPCQDYSVAHSLSNEKGIKGKKGILWWDIYEILCAKKPAFCIFENVDRLLKSPSKQRGRDFGIMLSCLALQGYSAEWRIVNSASYGAVQRRKRTFIFAYRNDTKYAMHNFDGENILCKDGFFANTFPVSGIHDIVHSGKIPKSPAETSDTFAYDFHNAGWMSENIFYTADVNDDIEHPIRTLGSIVEKTVSEKYYVKGDKLEKFRYLKSAKKMERKTKDGFTYTYSEGATAFPDYLDRNGRTMLTSEGTINRCSHIIQDETGNYRILTPVETERMQGFDDNWTNTGMSERMRYFCMGNALVVSMVTRMAVTLGNIIEKE